MRKLRFFSVILACLSLGLGLAGCENPADETSPVSTFTVSFNANGGSGTVPNPMAVQAGSSVTLPNEGGLSRSSYTFSGWNTNTTGAGTNYSAGASYTPTSNITLYARWNTVAVTTYTVTFNANGGSSTPPSAQTVQAGSSLTLPNEGGLSRSGYTFGGWNTNASGMGSNYAAGSSYTVTGNITLYARWIAAGTTNYMVIFNANGGGGTAPSAQTASSGSSITLPNEGGLSRSGYTFGGWNTNADGTGTNYSAGASYAPIANITLYAKWDGVTVTTYTVSFNVNGGSGTAPDPQTVQAGSSITIPSGNGLSMSGFIFDGWNIYTSGTGTNYSAGSSYTPTANITLYAKWDVAGVTILTVRFETNGGSSVGNAVILPYTTVSHPTPDPNLTGYIFDGWFADPELTEGYNFSSIVVRDITLYAKWKPITYTVAYNKNAADATGITEDSSHTYDVDGNLTPNVFTRKGFTFAGWARTSTGAAEFTDGATVKNLSAVAGATVPLYAQWIPNSASITLDVKQIVDGAPIIADITISRTNSGYPVTHSVSVNASDYDVDSIKWEVAGVGTYAGQTVTGSGASFALNAAEVKYNSLGGHALILTVTKGGHQYQRAIPFTIVH
jgi:uncharacterized repeat protein (TIGR02543 family)